MTLMMIKMKMKMKMKKKVFLSIILFESIRLTDKPSILLVSVFLFFTDFVYNF